MIFSPRRCIGQTRRSANGGVGERQGGCGWDPGTSREWVCVGMTSSGGGTGGVTAVVLVSEYLCCVAWVFLAKINGSVYNETLQEGSWSLPDGGFGGWEVLGGRRGGVWEP